MSDKMFSVDSVPWMKLGKLADKSATAEEAIAQSDLNFTVAATPTLFRTPDGELRQYADRFTCYREDTLEPLGVVSGEYEVVQYADAFAFMNNISPDFVAAGSLNGGKQGFMVVQIPDVEINPLNGDDPHSLYAILRTSHDRTRGIEVCAMPLRHRCMNQLGLSSFGSKAPLRWSIRHTKSAHQRLEEATYTLQHLAEYAVAYEQLVERLAQIKLPPNHAAEIIGKYVLPTWVKKRDEVTASITGLLTDERVGEEYANTGWGLVQAVSTYYEHERAGGTPQSRLLGALEGQTFKAITKTTNALMTRYSKLYV